jgi:hypothetical protein
VVISSSLVRGFTGFGRVFIPFAAAYSAFESIYGTGSPYLERTL